MDPMDRSTSIESLWRRLRRLPDHGVVQLRTLRPAFPAKPTLAVRRRLPRPPRRWLREAARRLRHTALKSASSAGRLRVALLLLPLLLSSCGDYNAQLAHAAQYAMVDMSKADLEACAGMPTHVGVLGHHVLIYEYHAKTASSRTFGANLPLIGGLALGDGGGAYCDAMFRIVDGRVTEVHYAGQDSGTFNADSVCARIVAGCMDDPEPSMRKLTPAIWRRIPADRPLAVPPQPSP